METLISAGASRVVIGSLAVRDTNLQSVFLNAFGPEKICLAADVIWQNDSFYIAVSGWQEASKVGLFAFIKTYLESGLQHTLCTDIDRDGTLLDVTVIFIKGKAGIPQFTCRHREELASLVI